MNAILTLRNINITSIRDVGEAVRLLRLPVDWLVSIKKCLQRSPNVHRVGILKNNHTITIPFIRRSHKSKQTIYHWLILGYVWMNCIWAVVLLLSNFPFGSSKHLTAFWRPRLPSQLRITYDHFAPKTKDQSNGLWLKIRMTPPQKKKTYIQFGTFFLEFPMYFQIIFNFRGRFLLSHSQLKWATFKTLVISCDFHDTDWFRRILLMAYYTPPQNKGQG